jgi:hypothetical protein
VIEDDTIGGEGFEDDKSKESREMVTIHSMYNIKLKLKQ